MTTVNELSEAEQEQHEGTVKETINGACDVFIDDRYGANKLVCAEPETVHISVIATEATGFFDTEDIQGEYHLVIPNTNVRFIRLWE